jgi:hypothetical protein
MAESAVITFAEVRDSVLAELDNQITQALVTMWINQEMRTLCTKREWNFFIAETAGSVGVADANGESTLNLPVGTKKLIEIYTRAPDITGDASAATKVTFTQGRHYRLIYDTTAGYYKAIFFNLGNTSAQSVVISFFCNPIDMTGTSDTIRMPMRFANVLSLATLRRCYRKLGDIQESILSDRQFKEELQSMIDDDAREHDLTKTLLPNRGQSREEYQEYLNDQRLGEPYRTEPYYARYS